VILLHPTSHVYHFEGGGSAAISGAMLVPVEGQNGMFDRETFDRKVAELGYGAPPRLTPRPAAVSVEQTTNVGGGKIWPLEQLHAVRDSAKESGLNVHMDGARLMNAVVASGIPAREWAEGLDTVWVDFSKGLGAPVGACLAGSAELIEEAWRFKQMLGGAMRQAGIIAAGALWALNNHIDRLAEDHENARILAEGLAEIPGISLNPGDVETNIIFFEVADASEFAEELMKSGVRFHLVTDNRMRAVTHLDVTADDIQTVIKAVRDVAARR
jgi:threonine aldolase